MLGEEKLIHKRGGSTLLTFLKNYLVINNKHKVPTYISLKYIQKIWMNSLL